jgi:hypothetical protein
MLLPSPRWLEHDFALLQSCSSHLGLPRLRFVEEGPWTYIHKVNQELYDTQTDPGESTNLAARHPEIVKRLRTRLGELLEGASAIPDDARVAVNPERTEELARLGYVAESGAPRERPPGESLELFGPDPATTAQQIVEAFPYDTAPGYVLRGRNRIYGSYFGNWVRGIVQGSLWRWRRSGHAAHR